MNKKELQHYLQDYFKSSRLDVFSNDDVHFNVTMVCDSFVGMSELQRQQKVMQSVMHFFASKQIHALNLDLFTHEEWISRV